MGLFTSYLNSHFKSGGCRLIARAHDKCRDRRVTLHAIPGFWDCVGVSDGTDAWVAPASAGLFFATATGDCADIMRRLQAGEELPPVPDWPEQKRARLPLEDEPAPRPRAGRQAVEAEEMTPRRSSRVEFV
jgi:hypothetical protein